MSSRSARELQNLIDASDPDLSIRRQCALLGLNPSTYYYEPRGESPQNLAYMRLMDERYLKTPYYGVGQMHAWLLLEGHKVNIKRIRRLYRLMGLRSLVPGPHTSKPGKGADYQVFPYLLRGVKIERVGQVIGVDITYIPMPTGFLYLVAFIDWYSRYVLSWELSNTLDSTFCVQALNRIWSQVKVEIINTDQGSQFTSNIFVKEVLKQEGVRLSMDGKGRALDNVFTERLWRSLKYEEIYIKEYENGTQAWKAINKYFYEYNHNRPHSKLNGQPPIKVFKGMLNVTSITIN